MSETQDPRSRIASSDVDRVLVRGLDLTRELIGKVDLGEMAFLELRGRLPEPAEARMFNALLVTLVEHGLTPSVIAARLTYHGAPEAIQAAVAAGLLGLGSTFVGTIEGSARLLQEALAQGSAGDGDLEAIAKHIVKDHRARKVLIPGLGHPLHKSGDPRSEALFELATELGLTGRFVALELELSRQASKAFARALHVNATGAIGAIASEMGFHWSITRGLGVISRAIGLVAHIAEERESPIAGEIWRSVESTHG